MFETSLVSNFFCWGTRQVCNLFDDLWNRFPYFEGSGVGAKSLGVRLDRQTDRHQTYMTGGVSEAARDPFCFGRKKLDILQTLNDELSN